MFADRILEITNTTGAGPYTLAGALGGYRAFGAAFPSGAEVVYHCTNIPSGGTQWESGIGVFDAGAQTISRFVLESSNGDALVNWPAGTKQISCAPLGRSLRPLLRLANAFAPRPQSPANMTVRLDAGHVFNGATLVEVAAQSTGAITAPANNPRRDIVYVDRATGAVGIAIGTEAASPADPAIPSGKAPVARVKLTVGMTAITNAILDDLRSLNLLGLGTAATRNTGTAAGDIPLLETGGKLPAVDGSQLTGIVSVPAGAIMAWPNAAEPGGWLFCGGQAVSRTTYAALFAVIGAAYGAGDGSTTFNLPDLRGRAAVGKDDMGGAAANRVTSGGSGIAGATLGASGGAETVTLSTAQMPAHTHTPGGGGSEFRGVTAVGVALANTAGGSTGGGAAHQNMPPALILNYIIKT